MEGISKILTGDAAIFEMDYSDREGDVILREHEVESLHEYLTESIATASSRRPVDSYGHIKIAIRRIGATEYVSEIHDRLRDCLAALSVPERAAGANIVRCIKVPPTWEELQTTDPSTRPITRSFAYHNVGIAWKYYPVSCDVVGLIWFEDDYEKPEVERLLSFLSERQPPLPHPAVIPLAFLTAMLDDMKRIIGSMETEVTEFQDTTGIQSLLGKKSGEVAAGVNLGNLSAEVSGKACNWLGYQLHLVSFGDICQELVTDCQSHALESPEYHNAKVHEYYERQVRQMCWWCNDMLTSAKRACNSSNVIIQGIFNLIAQRDSKANFAIARASRQDSAAMKAIAVVTMVFLPGTFVASFLAMPLFYVNQSTGGFGAHALWIYWAITIPLTILTIFSWWLWDKTSRQRSQARQQISETGSETDSEKMV